MKNNNILVVLLLKNGILIQIIIMIHFIRIMKIINYLINIIIRKKIKVKYSKYPNSKKLIKIIQVYNEHIYYNIYIYIYFILLILPLYVYIYYITKY